MNPNQLAITYVGGPTAVIQWGGLRFLTDPTFDPPGGEYATGPVTLRKIAGPALSPGSIGPIDVVLLSHDHHADNLDRAGRSLLRNAGTVITTQAGAEWLGAGAIGLANWQSFDVAAHEGRTLRITGTPARHGSGPIDRGPVSGFALAFTDAPNRAVYISGDTVWFEGVEEVARRFEVRVAVLFMGAALVRAVGPYHLTMAADDAVQAARAFPSATIVPLHFEGWAHYSESREQIDQVFSQADLEGRIRWLAPGQETVFGDM